MNRLDLFNYLLFSNKLRDSNHYGIYEPVFLIENVYHVESQSFSKTLR